MPSLRAARCEDVELVALVSEEAGEDLVERALAVAEAEAVLWRDRVELAVGEHGDSVEGAAGGR